MFVTLTAPSFGLVHTRRARTGRRGRGAAGRAATRPSARTACGSPAAAVHDEDDPCLGEPLCRGVLRPRGRGGLEQRARRAVAAHHDLPAAQARAAARHHAEAAAQAACASPTSRSPNTSAAGSCTCTSSSAWTARCPPTAPTRSSRPPRGFTVELLEHAIRAAAADVRAPLPDELGGGRVALGRASSTCAGSTRDERREVAGYLAKYATKSTELAGSVAAPRRPSTQVDAAAGARARARLPARRVRARSRPGARRPAVRRVRARARLPRPLPDQEPPLLHHLQGAAPGARAPRARAAARPLDGPGATRARRRRERVASFRYAGQGHITAADALPGRFGGRAGA